MSSSPTSKRIKTSVSSNAPSPHHHQQHLLLAPQQLHPYSRPASFEGIPITQPQIPPPPPPPPHSHSHHPTISNPRKRRSSFQSAPTTAMVGPIHTTTTAAAVADIEGDHVSLSNIPHPTPKKRGRTNTPWTAVEEQRLKNMRDAGRSWGEIAKTFPNRTEGSVKKHWYKDMHYAEFAEDESTALRDAIRDYEVNKWKIIGQKVGKPAKACEQYAKEHFDGSP